MDKTITITLDGNESTEPIEELADRLSSLDFVSVEIEEDDPPIWSPNFEIEDATTRCEGVPSWDDVGDVADILDRMSPTAVTKVARANGCIRVEADNLVGSAVGERLVRNGYVITSVRSSIFWIRRLVNGSVVSFE